MRRLNRIWPFLVFPAVIWVGATYIYPAILTVIFSFGEVDLVSFGVDNFVGFQNYLRAFGEPRYLGALLRTIYFAVVTVGAGLIISFLIAMLLNLDFWGRSVLRVAILLPWVVPPVVSGVVWGQLFHAEGIINTLLMRAGLISSNIVWLGEPLIALHIVIGAVTWRAIPFMTLFILAGLQSIPGRLYEAASIDGANPIQKFRFLTVPLLKGVLIPICMIQFVWTLKVFAEIFTLTGGGPSHSTTTLNFYVYQQAFEFLNLGYGSAVALLLLLLAIFMVLLFNLFQRLTSRT